MASFWHHFGVGLLSFSPHFEPFGAILAYFSPFLRSFCGFLVTFWEVDCKLKQNDVSEGKNMQISAEIHRTFAKICKNKPFFRI